MKTCLFLIACLMVSAVHAQESKLSLSLRGGLNISQVNGKTETFLETASKKGFSGGFSLGVKIKPQFLLLAEIIYDQRGFKEQIELTDPQGSSIGKANSFTNLNYISIPIIASAVIGDKYAVEIGAGVSNNLLISASTENVVTYYGFLPGSLDVKNSYKTYELSGVARLAGVFTLVPSVALILESRFQYGITPANKSYNYGYENFRNSVIYLGTGMRVLFNKKAQK